LDLVALLLDQQACVGAGSPRALGVLDCSLMGFALGLHRKTEKWENNDDAG
jgi:hypothetical protein